MFSFNQLLKETVEKYERRQSSFNQLLEETVDEYRRGHTVRINPHGFQFLDRLGFVDYVKVGKQQLLPRVAEFLNETEVDMLKRFALGYYLTVDEKAPLMPSQLMRRLSFGDRFCLIHLSPRFAAYTLLATIFCWSL